MSSPPTPSTRSGTGGHAAVHTVLLLGIAGLLLGTAATAAVRLQAAAPAAGEDAAALGLALGAVELALREIDANPSYTTGEVLPPSFPDGELRWVLDAAAAHAPISAPGGELVFIVPSNAHVVYGVGYVPSRTGPRRVRAVAARWEATPARAVVAGGSLTVEGNVSVLGTGGSVHANGDLTLLAGAAVDEDATASGILNVSPGASVAGIASGGVPPVQMPPLPFSAASSAAEYVLQSDGWITAGPANTSYPPGTRICKAGNNPARCYGWAFSKRAPQVWSYEGPGDFPGVFDIRTRAAVFPPSPMAAPWSATLVSSGSVEIGPGTVLSARFGSIAALAAGDLRTADARITGWLLTSEQAEVRGTDAAGGIIARSDTDSDTLVTGGSRLAPTQAPTRVVWDGLPPPSLQVPARALSVRMVMN